jgi:hypothetical protein
MSHRALNEQRSDTMALCGLIYLLVAHQVDSVLTLLNGTDQK